MRCGYAHSSTLHLSATLPPIGRLRIARPRTLVADLHGLRSTVPDVRIDVTDMETHGDLVFSTIQFVDGSKVVFAGIELERLPEEPLDEVLLIRDGVYDRTMDDTDWSVASLLNVAQDAVPLAGEGITVPELREWRIEPGGYGEAPEEAWRFLVVVSGSIGWKILADASKERILVVRGWKMAFGSGPAIESGLEMRSCCLQKQGRDSGIRKQTEARLLVFEVPRHEGTAGILCWNELWCGARIARTWGDDCLRIRERSLVSIGQVSLPSSLSWAACRYPQWRRDCIFVTGGSLNATTARGAVLDRRCVVSDFGGT